MGQDSMDTIFCTILVMRTRQTQSVFCWHPRGSTHNAMHCSRYSATSRDATPWTGSHFTSIPHSISHQRYLPLFLAMGRHNTAFATYATVYWRQRHCIQDHPGLSCGHMRHRPEYIVCKTNDSMLGWNASEACLPGTHRPAPGSDTHFAV